MLTTSTNTVANFLISMKMLFKKVFNLLFIIRQLFWANLTEVLKVIDSSLKPCHKIKFTKKHLLHPQPIEPPVFAKGN